MNSEAKHIEVFIRERCGYYECNFWSDEYAPKDLPMCPSCNGVGYITKWVSLETLVRKVI